MARSALLNVMVKAASKAGRRLTRDFGEVENLQVSVKGPSDFVSAADMQAEKIIRDELEYARPGYSFLLEEGGTVEGEDPQHRWIIDPLDGTTNFLHGVPHFAVSIALERQGVLIAGLIYNPVTDDMFTAERGQGAFLNDRRLRVANRSKLTDCIVTTGVPHLGRGNHGLYLRELAAVMGTTAGIRRFGSAALDLAWTAAGRVDGFWESDLKPWDMAAGIVILREAGGFVTDANGGDRIFETGTIFAGNERIQAALLKTVKDARKGG